MSYYDTIDEDLARAREILAKGKLSAETWTHMDNEARVWLTRHGGGAGAIYGADTFAAYKLLESFVAEIERLTAELAGCRLANAQWLEDINAEIEAGRRLADEITELRKRTDRQAASPPPSSSSSSSDQS